MSTRSLRSKRFRVVSEQKTRSESQRMARVRGEVISRAAKNPRIPFLSLSLLRNSMETIATQARVPAEDSPFREE